MQANLETLGSLQRKLNITVPMADIDVEVQSRLKRLTRTVRIDGFRPGKVPLTVVVKHQLLLHLRVPPTGVCKINSVFVVNCG